MTPERLIEVEKIYHSASGILPPEREKFLDLACGDDLDLRKEIESLLSFDSIPKGVIDSAPESMIAAVFPDQNISQMIGRRINQYKILSLIGEGGMGAVYLALDTKLERKVAIKFLSEKFVSDVSGSNRFFLEAKSASALNDPNIITVHEIGDVEGTPFIATEFIDGVTIKGYLAKEKTTLADILDISIQIVSALASAHKAGIIHRDIKTDNVMIRKDGIVKVLDFGLAKYSHETIEVDNEAQTRAKHSTIQGLVMGTPQYMSPEQARGKRVDSRTDIWSFGVVLYQMLTGQNPFQGETTSDVIASILKSEPPPMTDLVADIPNELQRITMKTLQKDLNERYRNSDELLFDLKNFRRELDLSDSTERLNIHGSDRFEKEKSTAGHASPITEKNSHHGLDSGESLTKESKGISKGFRFVYPLLAVGALILLVFGFLGYRKLNSNAVSNDPFQIMTLAKVTFDGTVSNIVTTSPDGRYVVYVITSEGKQSLKVRQVLTSSIVQLVAPANVDFDGISFSRDGNYVYYTVFEQGESGYLYEIPTLGGIPRKLASDVSGKVTFSPAGDSIAFVRSRTSLIVADAKGGNQRILATSSEGEIRILAEWSPNGKTIMSSIFSNSDSRHYLSEVSINDGSEKRFSNSKWLSINGLVWLSDGSGIFLSGRDPATKFSQVWSISYPAGELRRITNDFSTYVGLSITADDKTLFAVKEERLYNIWSSPSDDPQSARKITVEEGKDEGNSGIAAAINGKVVYTAREIGTVDIWSVNSDGTGNQQLTIDQGSNFSPVVSPDGRLIIFASNRTGSQEIWRMDIDGGNSIQLTNTPDAESNPNFSRDGRSIFYERIDSKNRSTIWKQNVDGGDTIQITQSESSRPVVSPDGRFFACEYGDSKNGNSAKLAILPIEGGNPLKVLDLPLVLNSNIYRWTSDGKSLVYVNSRDRVYNLWSQPIDNSPPKQLTSFESGKIVRFSLVPGSIGFVLSRGSESSDVVMINNFR